MTFMVDRLTLSSSFFFEKKVERRCECHEVVGESEKKEIRAGERSDRMRVLGILR